MQQPRVEHVADLGARARHDRVAPRAEAGVERRQRVEAVQRLAEAVDETVESERGVVNERNVCSQERDKGRVDATRQRQQALFEERAHTAALDRLEMARRSSCHSACKTRTGRHDPLQKLQDAPRAVEAAERAFVEPVSNRSQKPTVLSQRSLVKRATSGSA